MFRFYDDELHNLILVAGRSVREIISYTASYDYHPPLQYLFNKLSLELFGLNEFWLKLPSILFIILSIILCCHLVYKITGSFKLSLICGVISLSNPLILLWGASIRWYPIWTFLAVLSVYILTVLFTRTDKRRRTFLKCLLVLILTLALYTNYQTIVLIIALIITAFVLDLKERNKKYYHLKEMSQVVAGVFILFLPYVTTAFNHIETFILRKDIYSDNIGNSPILSGGYFIYSVLFGNSIYPWDIRFILLISISIIALTVSLIFYKKQAPLKTNPEAFSLPANPRIQSILLIFTINLFLLFLFQIIITGSLITRGFIILPLLIVPLTVVYIYAFSKRSGRKLFRTMMVGVISFVLVWIVGSYNVFSGQHLHKSGLEIPIEEVTKVINSHKNELENKFTVITTDFVLTYYLMKDSKLNVLSPYTDELSKLIEKKIVTDADRTGNIIFIKSYFGSLMPLKDKLINYSDYLFKAGKLDTEPIKLGYDPDYRIKIKFFPSSGIEEWRYIIYILEPIDSWDFDFLENINSYKVY